MGILSAKNIREALEKASGVGLVEEGFTIDGCEVVVRSLRPADYEGIHAECESLDDLPYLNAFQRGHVARAIVEINGLNLRDTEFIDEEEPDPKQKGATKKVKYERHAWLAKNVLNTWSMEAIRTAYFKVGDAVAQAELRAKEGITFRVPDETTEDKFRRLLGEAFSEAEDLPRSLVEAIYEEHGLVFKATIEEVKAVMERADALAREQEKEQAQQEQTGKPVEEVPVPKQEVSADDVGPSSPPVVIERPEDLMRNRRPMNAVSGDEPVPPARHVQRQQPPPSAKTESPTARASRIAALEADADQVGATVPGQVPSVPMPSPDQIPLLTGSLTPAAGEKTAVVLDQLPGSTSVNKHFVKPPPRRA